MVRGRQTRCWHQKNPAYPTELVGEGERAGDEQTEEERKRKQKQKRRNKEEGN